MKNRIGVWGDSITWGANDLEMGGWVARLRSFIDNEHELEPGVYNVGVSGDKVGNVLRRFGMEFEARQSETVILAIGINDSPHDTHPEGTPLDEFERQLGELIQKAKAGATKPVIFVGLTSVDDEHPKNSGYKNSEIKKYDEIVKKVTSGSKVTYLDVFDLITKDDLKMDGLHPEAQGHEKIFQAVKAALGY